MDPFGPFAVEEQRREHGEQHRTDHHHRGIYLGKAGDEIFRPRLFGAGVFHEIEDLRHRGFTERLGDLHPQGTALIDAAADHIIPRLHLTRQRLTGQRRGIHRAAAVAHHAVERDALAGLDHDHLADRHLFGIHLDQFTILLPVGVIRADIHQLRD